MPEAVDVAIVGGGPAGAALAIRLARAGIATTVFERQRAPAWRASGVFSSPLTRKHLGRLGLSEDEVAALNRPISALNLETTRGVRCRLEYRHGPACGFDRLALESTLLDQARAAGAEIRAGTVVRNVELPRADGGRSLLTVSATTGGDRTTTGEGQSIAARLVVGADGATSVVARASGTYRTHRRFDRSGITFHRADPSARAPGEPMEGRFVFGDGWYVGVAPVPADRVNVGIVVPAIREQAPADIAARIADQLPGNREPWMDGPITDRVTVAGRLEHHASHFGGRGWLLVGDAIGFLDPLSGEGLLRAFATARLAAHAVQRSLSGNPGAFEDYDQRIRDRFRGKDMVSWMLQLFLARGDVFDYALRRLAARQHLREELALVLTDQQPASRAVNPRFITRLLAP